MGAIIVKKFGGSSLATVNHIKNVTNLIKDSLNHNYRVIIIVSAMGKSTDSLLESIEGVNKNLSSPEALAECDKVLATGEQVSCGLLALSLLQEGIKAKSMLGWQLPILTNNKYGEAIIEKIGVNKLLSFLNQGFVVIIAGFQGVYEGEITTLGRNSSDTTAAAIAAATKAVRCEIYCDVEGVYTADPKLVENAKVIENISYQQMLTLSTRGAKIMHNRAVEIAQTYNFPLKISSTFKEHEGTLVNQPSLERPIWGIAFIEDLTLLTITKAKYNKVNKFLTDNSLSCAFSFQKSNKKILIVVEEKAARVLFTLGLKISFSDYKVCIISLVGNTLVSISKMLQDINTLFIKEGISIDYIFTCDTVITVLLANTYLKKALNLLHSLLEPINFVTSATVKIEKLQLLS